jgi:hypothetical protein
MVNTVPDNINIIENIDSVNENLGECKTVVRHYWWRNEIIIEKLLGYLNTRKINSNVIDVGCAKIPFEKATHVIDFENETNVLSLIPQSNKLNIDLDVDKIPAVDKFFNFVYCRHTVEDIANPEFALREMMRVSPRGYIETPSPLIECLRNIDGSNADKPNIGLNYCGYIHHRYIVWSNKKNNTIYFLPKYPIIEFLSWNPVLLKKFTYIANNYPVYWNNYYLWDENNSSNIIVYRHGVNFEVDSRDYPKLLFEGIKLSIEYTNHFLGELLK